uniref:Ion transport domain-containing protein n=1 Tax=Globisporangium ultimum (strain ATCC 200006 / CBS 805.95 / DAOM BR144) TaxID=431595 RepID=K3WWJ5_GLOUD
MKRLVKTDAFRATVHFIVIADIAVLALDDDYHNGSAYVSLDIAFTLLIGLEIVLKSIAFGLYSGPESYLKRSRFRILNLIVLAASLVSHLGGAKLRVLRGIKTFRSLTMHSGLRRILRSLIRAIPFLANVGTLALFFLLAFSIFGLEAYHGAYDNQCSVAVEGSNSSIADTIFEALPRAYCSGNDSCAANNQACLPLGPPSKHINFDSGISSIFLVFLVVAQDGWVTDIMKPVLEGTSYWSVAFFVLIIASMVFLVQ